MTNSEKSARLRAYREKLRTLGFKRVSYEICPELVNLLRWQRLPGECGGRTLERMLLGVAAKRPEYWLPGERPVRGKRARRDA